MGSERFELSTSAMSRHLILGVNDLNEYLLTIELSGITTGHIKEVKRFLEKYLEYINYRIDKSKSIAYFKLLKNNNSLSYYRKQLYQILKFLTHINVEWTKEIKPPSDPIYYPKRITEEIINQTISYFKGNQHFTQIIAIITLGISSGLRAEEIYQLSLDDIDLESRTVHINHNPTNGQSTKTKRSRISFFSKDTKQALSEYLTHFNHDVHLKTLFSQTHISRLFRNAPIRVKDLRKFFSQEWDRRGGPTSIKKILMGHSLRNDVDLMHYNAQSPDDLKKIYDRVMGVPILKDN